MICPALTAHPGAPVTGPVVFAIMDGVGLGCGDAGDAVAAASTPTLDRLAKGPLRFALAAHGRAVGMPSDDDMGNSEVGHNALGAGRVFDQGAKLVGSAMASGAAFDSPTWAALCAGPKQGQGTLHLIGLLSDGNVHSHCSHLQAMLQRAHSEGVRRVRLHVLLDGRDVARTSALQYVAPLEAQLQAIGAAGARDYAIASGGGRMQITMDRYEADWDMVRRGWQTHVEGQPLHGGLVSSATAAIEAMRAAKPGIGDQDLPPFVVGRDGAPVGRIEDGDSVLAFNFRGDRMLELVTAFEDDNFSGFARPRRPQVRFAGMTLYDGDTQRPRAYLVAPPQIACTLSELLCAAGVAQLACSETQKFGHVTYFWNGNRSGFFDPALEKAVEIPSSSLPFAEQPQMQAEGIAEAVTAALTQQRARFIRLNLANGDMVGHTGDFAATVRAMVAVDAALAKIERSVRAQNGILVVTADHGNAEDMGERNKDGSLRRDEAQQLIAKTSHSLNPVPCYVSAEPALLARLQMQPVTNPGLAHVAATLCTLLGFAAPALYLPSLLQWRPASTNLPA